MKTTNGDKLLIHEKSKQIELIWALSLQEYNNAAIARIFGVDRSTVLRIIRRKPRDWKSPWTKVRE